MSYLKQISPILRVRNRTELTAQPQSLEAIALKVSSDFTGSTSGQKKSSRRRKSSEIAKALARLLNAVYVAAVTHRRKSTP